MRIFFWYVQIGYPACSHCKHHVHNRTPSQRTRDGPMQLKLAVTLREASALSGLSRSTFYKLFRSGVLKPRKVGKRVLILMPELEAFIRTLPTGSDQHER
ncbi:helix-turn-helix domain-containing protein [Mesorhizobium liriopis]|uniref:helix-turn-helix domain-containing protein n=1 Tax=Mesorhizobium liriopis TaxID=2953882 RepID=UPI00338FD157